MSPQEALAAIREYVTARASDPSPGDYYRGADSVADGVIELLDRVEEPAGVTVALTRQELTLVVDTLRWAAVQARSTPASATIAHEWAPVAEALAARINEAAS